MTGRQGTEGAKVDMSAGVITAVYSRSWSIGGPLIRHADRWGRWSHCGILDDGEVLEARAFHGVVATPWDDFVDRVSTLEIVPIVCPDAAAGLAWAHAQVGKGYDYLAIAGNLFRVSWQAPERWQCAEYLEGALAQAGRRRFRHAAWRISPTMSWAAV